MMFKKKIIEIGEEMTKFWHLEKMCRYKNSEKLIVAHVIRVRSAWQKPKKLNHRAMIIKYCSQIQTGFFAPVYNAR